MSTLLPTWLPLLLLLTPLAMANEGTPSELLEWNRILALGPYGALVWGAVLIGRALEKLTQLKITVQVELSETDRRLLRRLARTEEVSDG